MASQSAARASQDARAENNQLCGQLAEEMANRYGWHASFSHYEIQEHCGHGKATVRGVYDQLREVLGREPQRESEADLARMASAAARADNEQEVVLKCLAMLEQRAGTALSLDVGGLQAHANY